MRAAHPGTDIRALTAIEQLILRLLREHGDTYGFRLIALSDGALRQGTVYVTLDRMQTKGYVESWLRVIEGLGGGPRRVYRPTPHGLRMLEAQEVFARAVAESVRGA